MRCFKVTVEFDGTEFCGFQLQAGQRSVQGEIERAVQQITGQPVRVVGAGRTDAGVHAMGQVVGFRADTRIPIERMAAALNSALPRDVAAVRAVEVDPGFHARFSAVSRAYAYLILLRDSPSALFRRYAWHLPVPLDVGAMQEAARRLEGTRDFAAWAGASETVTTVRTVTRCRLRQHGPFLMVHVEANAFLKGMVRTIVGTLVQVGLGRRAPEEMDRITGSRDRSQAGPSAPAHGLCLVRVRYPRIGIQGGARSAGRSSQDRGATDEDL